MKKILIALTLSFSSFSAFALVTKDFNCKNTTGLPDNTYKFSTTMVNKVELPVVQVTRYYFENSDDGTSKMVTAKLTGVGTVLSIDGAEVILLGTMRFAFDGDQLQGCR